MVNEEAFKAMLRDLLKKQGYVVVGIPLGVTFSYRVGEFIDKVFNVNMGTKWEVTGVAKEADWNAQIAAIAELRPNWPRLNLKQVGGQFFKVKPLGPRKVVTM